MKQSEIKELSVEELQEKLEINKKKYTDLKALRKTGRQARWGFKADWQAGALEL